MFQAKDRRRVDALGAVATVNPFSAERRAVERVAIPDFSTDAQGDSERARQTAICGQAEHFLFEARRKRSLDKVYGEGDEERYARLFFVWSYHTLIERIDHLIRDGVGRQRRDLKLFQTFVTQYDELAPAFWRTLPHRTPEHLFAAYFQIRRAFHHIFSNIIGESVPVLKLRSRVWESIFTVDMLRYQRVLTSRLRILNTLVTGPSGSGKELVARAVGLSGFIPFTRESGFAASADEGFFPVNLSALTATLIESELFGHRRGAFTGAMEDRRGYFEEAGSYGCVFLDEIGEAEASIQVKLLRVLQTREFQRLGETTPRPALGKIIAATNRDLEKEIAQGQFREDLYFRLCADRIETAPLRAILDDRPEDLRLMIDFVAVKLVGPEEAASFAEKAHKTLIANVHPEHPWRGNFRELERMLSNFMIHGEAHSQRAAKSGTTSQSIESAVASLAPGPIAPLIQAFAQRVWEETGSYRACAAVLGVDQRTAKKWVDGPVSETAGKAPKAKRRS